MNVSEPVRGPVRVSAPPQAHVGAQTHVVRRVLQLWAVPVALFLFALLVLFQYDPLHRVLTEDPSIFAYISKLVALGLPPHRYAMNEQASLAFLLGGVGMNLAAPLGLNELFTYRLLSMAVAAGVAVLTYLLGWRVTRSRLAGLLAALIMVGFEGYGARAATALEPKSVMLLFGLLTLYALTWRRWFWAGLFAGITGLAWQIGWGFMGVVVILALAQNWPRHPASSRSLAPRGRHSLPTCGGGPGRGAFVYRPPASRSLAPCGRPLSALLPALLGFILPLIPYAAYFIWQGALLDMLQQTVLAPAMMHQLGPRDSQSRLHQLLNTYWRGYRTHVPFTLLALVAWAGLLGRSLRQPRRLLHFFLLNPRTGGMLLVLHGYLFYCLVDFQNYPDWIPLLPFVSILAAWFLVCLGSRTLARYARNPVPTVPFSAAVLLILLVGAISTSHAWIPQLRSVPPVRTTVQQQLQAAAELNKQLPPDVPIWSIGKPDLLYFMGRLNLNRYIYVFGSTDAVIDAFEPGGFEGMLQHAQEARPVFVVVSRTRAKTFIRRSNLDSLRQWVRREYVQLQACRVLGDGRFYVRADLADALFPSGSTGLCVHR